MMLQQQAVGYPYRKPNLEAENQRLQAALTALEAKKAKLPKPWTEDQRDAAHIFLSILLGLTSIVLIAAAGITTGSAPWWTSVILYTSFVATTWCLLRVVSGHWAWWQAFAQDPE